MSTQTATPRDAPAPQTSGITKRLPGARSRRVGKPKVLLALTSGLLALLILNLAVKAGRHSELAHLGETAREIEVAGAFPELPLAVVTGAKTPSRLAATQSQIDRRERRQAELATLSPHGQLILAPASGYLPHITDPDTVAQAVRQVAEAGR